MAPEDEIKEKFLKNIDLKNSANTLLEKLLSIPSSELSSHDKLLIAFFHKGMDLFSSILVLQKAGYMESAQSLVRNLFETNLKFRHFIEVTEEQGKVESVALLLESLVIIKLRDATLQNAFSPETQSFQQMAAEIESRYSEQQLKKIRSSGFTMMSIEQLAQKYISQYLYDSVYRSLSRNVHAYDMVEYLIKQGILEDGMEDNIFTRDGMILGVTFDLFLPMYNYTSSKFPAHSKADPANIS